MKISLNCKLDSVGAYGFIKPISDIEEIKKIYVFRDEEAIPCKKTQYYTPFFTRGGYLGQISKFLKMLKLVDRKFILSIGIYEIPHGLLAFLIGKLKGVSVVISVIGNPGYTKIRKGIRKKNHFISPKKMRICDCNRQEFKSFFNKKWYLCRKNQDITQCN